MTTSNDAAECSGALLGSTAAVCEPTLEQEIAELKAVFDLRWKADMRAIKKWQETTGEDLTWPDHADLVVYLMNRLTAAESVIDIAGEQCEITIPEGQPIGDFEAAALNTSLHIAAYNKEFAKP